MYRRPRARAYEYRMFCALPDAHRETFSPFICAELLIIIVALTLQRNSSSFLVTLTIKGVLQRQRHEPK